MPKTHLLQQPLPTTPYLLLRHEKAISVDDTVIFQDEIKDTETPVKIVSVETGGKEEGQTRGLHTAFQIISWAPLP